MQLKGSYSDQLNSTTCSLCQIGHHQPYSSQTKCLECGVGTFCDREGCEVCDSCEAGTEAIESGQNNCTMCDPGYFKPTKSKARCMECETGWISIIQGAVVCAECPKGFFCPCSSCEPRVCPSDSVCPAGSAEYIECDSPFYYVRDKSDDRCTETVQFYVLVFGSIAAILVLIIVALVTIRKKRSRKYIDKLEYKKSLLKDEPEILYHGY